MTVSINGTSGLTFNDSSTQNTAPKVGMVNRIINGAMVIDQRNSGASVTQNTAGIYTVDRWQIYGAVTSKFTAQQNAVSVTPPSGFTNYLGCTSSSAYTVGAADGYTLGQNIEGLNVSDLGWGTANAQSVTVSFWVRSSLTGTFGGSIQNNAQNRSYPFSYTVSSTNTWEQKSITIAGDTSGTWLTTNGIGIRLNFSLGAGSTWSGTAGAWNSNFNVSATGATSVVGTNGATFYITGVQLEKGSTATSFDYRPYGTELALCQRYFEIGATDSVGGFIAGAGVSIYGNIGFRVTKRATPTMSAPANWVSQASAGGETSRTFGTGGVSVNGYTAQLGGSDPRAQGSWLASAEL